MTTWDIVISSYEESYVDYVVSFRSYVRIYQSLWNMLKVQYCWCKPYRPIVWLELDTCIDISISNNNTFL